MNAPLILPANPTLPAPGKTADWGRLIGASLALAAAELARSVERPLLVLAEDAKHADQLEAEIRFFAGSDTVVEHFVEWETLPWDAFSPHQDIVSQRLRVLAGLPGMRRGVVIAAATALQQRLPPVAYVAARSLSLRQGEEVPREAFGPARLRDLAYLDEDLRISGGDGAEPRHLMEPSPLAKLIQLAEMNSDDLVLDIGCASGYSAAVISRIAGSVIAIESDEERFFTRLGWSW